MKQVVTYKEEVPGLQLKTSPCFFESLHLQKDIIVSFICNKNDFHIDDSTDEECIIVHAIEKSEDGEKIIKSELQTSISSSEIYHAVMEEKDKLDIYSHMHISQIKLPTAANGIFIGCTFYPKELTSENKIQTYLLYFMQDEYVKVLLSENDSITDYKKVTSLQCSSDARVISIILGNDTHVCLRADTNEHDFIDPCITGFTEELRNTTRVINAESVRTLYSTISSSGNRIAIGNRDNRNAVKNNSPIATVGNITFLVYNHFKKQWIVEDNYFERNLYIENLGEHVSMNGNGDKLITTAKYIDDKGNNRNVIYLLSRDSKGKWKKFVREIVEEKIFKLEISSDGNKALVHIYNNYGTPRVSQGLLFFFREGKDMFHIILTSNTGELIAKDEEKKYDYIFSSVTSAKTLTNLIVAKGRLVNEVDNSEKVR